MIDIKPADLSSNAVRELVALHLSGMHASSPPETVYALDLSELQAADVTVWAAWIDRVVVGIAALKALSPISGEIKSMRTHPDHLRKGIGAALLMHLLEEAKARKWHQISLETGDGAPFEAALSLYRRHGFAEGPIFSDYEANPFSRFYHLRLDPLEGGGAQFPAHLGLDSSIGSLGVTATEKL